MGQNIVNYMRLFFALLVMSDWIEDRQILLANWLGNAQPPETICIIQYIYTVRVYV